MVGQEKKIPYECLRNVLRSLQICFTIVTNACLRILTNAVANLTNVLGIKQQHNTCVAYLHIHIADLSFCFLFARLFPISVFPIILILRSAGKPVFRYTLVTRATPFHGVERSIRNTDGNIPSN